jgi:hypothetical protein
MSNAHTQYPWRRPVLDAILESNPERRLVKLSSAERVILKRLHQKPADPDEQLALQYAFCDLKVLESVIR